MLECAREFQFVTQDVILQVSWFEGLCFGDLLNHRGLRSTEGAMGVPPFLRNFFKHFDIKYIF